MTISNCEFRIAECATSLISVIAQLRALSWCDPLPMQTAVAADVSRLKLLPRRNNERTDVRCYDWNASPIVPEDGDENPLTPPSNTANFAA